MSRYDSKADFKVLDMRTMGKPRDAEAMELLKRISFQVQPIMRRREWRVPLLSEFFPANPNLLGLNIGGGGGRTREIKVRLRPARDPGSFLPYESVLGTMLHELVHNVRGPHDSVFYKLLDEITSECEELMAKGVGGTGVGFDGPSCGRLGSYSFIPAHNPPPGRLRDAALQAAEGRAKRQRIMPTGPQRLGGGALSSLPYATPAAAAAAAAERRCRDNRWCPCERLAGALNKALAVEAEAGTKRAAGSSGVGPGAGTGGKSKGPSDAAASRGGAPGFVGPAGHVPPGWSDRHRSLEEVEADLVRQVEEGIIDLTLDSDPDSVLGLEPNDVGDRGRAGQTDGSRTLSASCEVGREGGGGGGRGAVSQMPAAAKAGVAKAAAGNEPEDVVGGGKGVHQGFHSTAVYSKKYGTSAASAATPAAAPAPTVAAAATAAAAMAMAAMHVKRRRSGDEWGERGSGGTGGSGSAAGGGWAVRGGARDSKAGASGEGVRGGRGLNGSAGPGPVAVTFTSGGGGSAASSSTNAAAAPAMAAPAVAPPPGPRPPLQVLQPRNATAAAAAAAALARMLAAAPPPAEPLPRREQGCRDAQASVAAPLGPSDSGGGDGGRGCKRLGSGDRSVTGRGSSELGGRGKGTLRGPGAEEAIDLTED